MSDQSLYINDYQICLFLLTQKSINLINNKFEDTISVAEPAAQNLKFNKKRGADPQCH